MRSRDRKFTGHLNDELKHTTEEPDSDSDAEVEAASVSLPLGMWVRRWSG